MGALWRWLIAFLVWLSADPQAVDLEAAKAAAAASVARASMVVDAPAPPAPAPDACECGQACSRGVWKPDGKIPQQCKCSCKRCREEREKGKPGCPDGKCHAKNLPEFGR